MATNQSQNRWRSKNRYVKKQLNVMARVHTHDALEEIAGFHGLRGKGEALAYACFVIRGLQQQAEFNPEARRLLDLMDEAYHCDRDLYAP